MTEDYGTVLDSGCRYSRSSQVDSLVLKAGEAQLIRYDPVPTIYIAPAVVV